MGQTDIMTAPHPLDHLVLPTARLDTARARLSALGFTVAPKGVHPFGTENRCVYLADGTFMEPLAVGDAAAADAAERAGNVFVARDRLYRQRLGEEGFSAVVFGTDDADADHERYVQAGISAGDRLDFSRPFVDAAGRSDVASFRLAFASDRDTPDAFVFACQRVNAPKVDRAALQAHGNGATAIAEVVAVAGDPAVQLALLATAAGLPSGAATMDGLVLPNARLTVLEPADFEARFGIAAGPPSALRFAAVVFRVAALQAVAGLLARNGVEHHLRGESLIAPAAPGQGAPFVYEEKA